MELTKDEKAIILNAIKNFDGPEEIVEKVETDFKTHELGNDEMQFLADALTHHLKEVKDVRNMTDQPLGAMATEEEYLEIVEKLIERLQPVNE